MKLVIIRNPFNISDRVFISLGDDTTKTILEHLTDNFDEEFNIDDWHVSHNGFLIDQEQIRIGKLFHDDYLCVLPIVAKGGGGKNPLKILATIALTAVAFGGFGSIGGFFGKTMGKQLLLGAAMMLGGSLLSGVGKTPEIDMPGIEGSAWENSYEWDRGQPSDSQGKAIPVTYGTVRMQGGQIVSQHVSTNGDKQFLNLLLCGGEGPIDSISDVKINGNSIESLANVGDGSSDSNFTESLSATPVIKQTSSTCTGFDIEIKYPNGLYYSTTWSGTKATSHIHVEYKLNSDSTWISLFDGTHSGNRTTPLSYTFRKDDLPSGLYDIRVTQIAAVGNAYCEWTRLSDMSYSAEVEVLTRLGTNDQTVIPGFGDTYSDQAINIELDDSVWTNYTTDGNAVEGIEVALELPSGLGYVKDNGDMQTSWVKVQAQYRIAGAPSWTNWDTWTIEASKKGSVRRAFRIDDLPAAQYEVQLLIDSVEGTTSRYINDIVWSQLTSIIYDDFSRPGRVLLGLKALATSKLSGSIPRISWTQTRSTVNVYDPDLGAYVTKAADNPAWIVYDAIHRARHLKNINTGLFEYIIHGDAHTKLEYQDFSNWADFCDTLVDGEKRCVANCIIDVANDLWAQVQKIALIGRGAVVQKGTKWSCIWDGVSDPVQLFSVGNIQKDSFTCEYMSMDNRANAIEASFINEDKDFQRDTLIVYDEDYDTAEQINSTQVFFPGITDYRRVYREAKYRLRLNKYLKRTVGFSTDVDAVACQVGDVVLVQHDVPRWGEGGRLVGATSNTVTLDKEVSVEIGKTYQIMVRHLDDTLETVTIAPIVTTESTDTFTLTAPWTQIPVQYDVYSFGEENIYAKPFRVLKMTREGDLMCSISAIEYYPEVYSESMTVPTISYSIPLPKVTNLAIEFEWDNDGNGNLDITWDIPRESYGGAVVLVNNVKVAQVGITERSFKHRVRSPGNHIIQIQGLDTTGNQTGFLNGSYSVNEYTIPQCTSVAISENTYKLNDGTVLTDIPVTFTIPEFRWFKAVNVYYQINESGSWILDGSTDQEQHLIKAISASKVQVRVNVVSKFTVEGPPASSSILTLTGKSDPPANVTGFTAAQELDILKLTWDENDPDVDPDIAGYEIRLGSTWASGTKVYAGKINYAPLNITSAGMFKYWIAAKDNSRNYSATPVSVTVTVNLPAIVTAIATAINGGIQIDCTHANDSRFSYYVVERAPSTDTSSPIIIDSGRKEKFQDTDIATLGYTDAWVYRVKAIDRNGSPGASSPWTTATTAKKIESIDITSGQIIGKDFRTSANAADGVNSGVKVTSTGIEGYNGSTKNFGLDQYGILYAQGATIAGNITAASGNIGGWDIMATYLASANGCSTISYDGTFTGGVMVSSNWPLSGMRIDLNCGTITAGGSSSPTWSLDCNGYMSVCGEAQFYDRATFRSCGVSSGPFGIEAFQIVDPNSTCGSPATACLDFRGRGAGLSDSVFSQGVHLQKSFYCANVATCHVIGLCAGEVFKFGNSSNISCQPFTSTGDITVCKTTANNSYMCISTTNTNYSKVLFAHNGGTLVYMGLAPAVYGCMFHIYHNCTGYWDFTLNKHGGFNLGYHVTDAAGSTYRLAVNGCTLFCNNTILRKTSAGSSVSTIESISTYCAINRYEHTGGAIWYTGLAPAVCGCMYYIYGADTGVWNLTINKYGGVNIGAHTADCAGSVNKLWVNGQTVLNGGTMVCSGNFTVKNTTPLMILCSGGLGAAAGWSWRAYDCVGSYLFAIGNDSASTYDVVIANIIASGGFRYHVGGGTAGCVNSSGNWSFATSDVAGVDTKLYSLISCSAGYAIKGVNSHTSAGYGIYGETFSLYGTSGKFVGGNFCIELSSPTYNCLMINNLPTGSGTSLVISSGSVMISSSSRRFKSNINPLEHAPEKFAKLQPSYFNYNGEKKITYGLIAEEVNELYPHLVHHENGKPFSVNYDGVSVLALAAAQALKVELDETKNRVSKLENMEV